MFKIQQAQQTDPDGRTIYRWRLGVRVAEEPKHILHRITWAASREEAIAKAERQGYRVCDVRPAPSPIGQ